MPCSCTNVLDYGQSLGLHVRLTLCQFHVRPAKVTVVYVLFWSRTVAVFLTLLVNEIVSAIIMLKSVFGAVRYMTGNVRERSVSVYKTVSNIRRLGTTGAVLNKDINPMAG